WRPAPPEALRYNPDWTRARRRLFSECIDVVEGVPGENDEYMDRVKHRLWDGDQLMDEVANMFRRLKPGVGRRLFEQALEEGIEQVKDSPSELVALFKQLDRFTGWLDRAAVE